ncbi:MAG: SUMF1/EgtB/PvdO family nonheme iron enzyme, partial [Candidatus Hydrogenedentes bacterium]|nr:SUMF1/EgtB/PvdO family nonheme iron enzyme [Candidatus Hydrogenedentota bacterium]
FVQWSDGVLTAARTDLNVTANISVTASFAVNTYTLTYTAGANGSITGTTPQTVNHGADGTEVTATPDTGYHFVQWSDGLPMASRTDLNVTANLAVTAEFEPISAPELTTLSLNSGDTATSNPAVTLNNTCAGSPTQYMASEDPAFTGASWATYGTAPTFTLSIGVGARTVYFKVKNAIGESGVASDSIFLEPQTVSVAAGTFDMGRTSAGDDAAYGQANELPVHSVTLGAYQIGKFEATNQEYCDVLNWALAKGYLRTAANAAWAGTGSIYADADGAGAGTATVLLVNPTDSTCNIQFGSGVFTPKTRTGLPGTTSHSMAPHPMVQVSWWGAVAFCNWLSEMRGLASCYDMNTAGWPLVIAPPAPGGYRLPTEAEWERAAAWNGTKHWIYGFSSDTLTGKNRVNYNDSNPNYVNPLGLTSAPYTSPVGWFNGTNTSPNGSVTTVNSVSPVGAYDMSGNVWEWCGDWYLDTYYSGGAMTNPTGPGTGSDRVLRGGAWNHNFSNCLSARRNYYTPAYTNLNSGFRVSRTPSPLVVKSFSVNGGAVATMDPAVTLNNTCAGSPTQYMASEDPAFTGASWATYGTAPTFTLSIGVGARTVYFKVKNAIGESGVASDSIFLEPQTVSVAAGTFDMGRTSAGDDAAYGQANELPVHSVTLGAYQIGKFEATNQEYCDVLNWALAKGYLRTAANAAWAGTGSIYADADGAGAGTATVLLVNPTDSTCNIQFGSGVFTPKTRTGLPGTTSHSMAPHPMVQVSWWGAVAFCNWLSEMRGLASCYDMNTAGWPLVIAPPAPGGYRLPTEAEWERAAAWNGTKHWIYGFSSDTLTGKNRVNYNDSNPNYVNPLGLTSAPYTSPVGWFNGTNTSPNGSVTTVNSVSPVGAYDMSGNVWEWCGDWYLDTYYSGGAMTNPTGPGTGSDRVLRGGAWNHNFSNCLSARRNYYTPAYTNLNSGFRVSRTP